MNDEMKAEFPGGGPSRTGDQRGMLLAVLENEEASDADRHVALEELLRTHNREGLLELLRTTTISSDQDAHDTVREAVLQTQPDDDDPLCECMDCTWMGAESEVAELQDAHERILPGEAVFPGECPECHAGIDYAEGHEPLGSVQYELAGYGRIKALLERSDVTPDELRAALDPRAAERVERVSAKVPRTGDPGL
jgi:hypothetical protein